MDCNTEQEPIYMMLHQLVHMSKYQALKRLEDFNLKPSQAGILFVLSCHGQMSQRQLAKKIGITPPSMTVALKKLEELGYVGREQDTYDQRIFRMFLTEKGNTCVGDIKNVLSQLEEVLYQTISQEEKLFFRRLLTQMKQNLLESKEFQGMNMKNIMEQTHPVIHGEF